MGQISSLSLYSLTFALARHGMHGKSPLLDSFPCLSTTLTFRVYTALHTDLHASLHKLAVSPTPTSTTSTSNKQEPPGVRRGSKAFGRSKQVRVVLEVCGMSRLGVQREVSRPSLNTLNIEAAS